MGRCNREIFTKGKPVAIVWSETEKDTEKWVKNIGKKARARVDWHVSGGYDQILHLGDSESRKRVEAAINELTPTFNGRIIKRLKEGESGLYRAGITKVPTGTVAVAYNELSGQNEFHIKK
jgi:hypothetical protein